MGIWTGRGVGHVGHHLDQHLRDAGCGGDHRRVTTVPQHRPGGEHPDGGGQRSIGPLA
ncbi:MULTISPECIES: hypothetical protein [Mycolicibacterium]|uniref:hypothetical protein n=1 Tax=Mycolicibacterium TaxID=1866885 RepID=UPI0013FE1EF0|nr:hypothetical protein [Mycolicibacterium rhodesiae]MCV7343304.1 hypothetical protein [Mycolicibacterium rhodesiae]